MQLVVNYWASRESTVYLVWDEGPARMISIDRCTLPEMIEHVKNLNADAVHVDATGLGLVLYQELSNHLPIPVHRLKT